MNVREADGGALTWDLSVVRSDAELRGDDRTEPGDFSECENEFTFAGKTNVKKSVQGCESEIPGYRLTLVGESSACFGWDGGRG